jgi:hypothetical protein
MPPENCPNCGADVPEQAKACPGCGADEETGWSDEAYVSRLGLPGEDSFDYDGFVQREFGGEAKAPRRAIRPTGVRWHWWAVAVLLVFIFVLYIFNIR